jgi:hypothetical protein
MIVGFGSTVLCSDIGHERVCRSALSSYCSAGAGIRSMEGVGGWLCTVGQMSMGRDSDWLRAGRSGERILVGARFSAAVHTDPLAHPASYTVGTGSFPGVKRPVRGVEHPPTSMNSKLVRSDGLG